MSQHHHHQQMSPRATCRSTTTTTTSTTTVTDTCTTNTAGAAACSHYEILKLEPSATMEEIKQAYRREARKYHPDRNIVKNDHGQHWGDQSDRNREHFQKIQAAYETLIDPDQRGNYDRCQSQYRYSGAVSVDMYRSELAVDEDGQEIQVYLWNCRCGQEVEYVDGDDKLVPCPMCSIVYDAPSLT